MEQHKLSKIRHPNVLPNGHIKTPRIGEGNALESLRTRLDAEDKLRGFNRLTQTTLVQRKFGQPGLWELNTVYGYYAMTRALTEDEYNRLLNGPSYDGPLHPAEQKAVDNPVCG